ncbi:MAG: aminotransferase class I/II-fold pyridoxal phosphate-dependent enzyme [Phycisphaerales bacterium]|nr:aminotransferase class I/II-fold pyridoxal phosphate-dependent enzyme [Phycisphaerales bacterium]
MRRPHGVTGRLSAYGTTIFAEMTALAVKHGAVNLAQGFPDFDGPEFLKEAAAGSMRAGHNQYARSHGLPALNRAIAESWKRSSGLSADPDTMVTVTSGCTEALAAAFLGLIEPGDGVILLEPFYDSYHAGVSMAGGVVKAVPLHRGKDGEFRLDPAELRSAVGQRTRAIVVNTPHNPTGKVFTRDELSMIASLCVEHDLLAITDEVYERLTFDAAFPHVHLATLPGMAERTVTLSSLGKTFSVTGWKVGWAIASPELSRGVRAAHQFLTFATSTPFQHSAALAVTPGGPGDGYARQLRADLREARDFLHAALTDLGFGLGRTRGTYFILADHRPVSGRIRAGMTGREFCRWLPEHAGVAAIPASAFYEHKELGEPLVRFAFCKTMETLREGATRLRRSLK